MINMESVQLKETLRQHSYTLVRRIGKGGFGKVFTIKEFDSELMYAVKTVSVKQLQRMGLLKYLQQEIDTMKQLNHPNIVRLIDIFKDKAYAYLVMEYCNKGNIAQLQAQQRGFVFNICDAKYYFHQIIQGVREIHRKNIIHRDLKNQNVLIHQDMDLTASKPITVCKIADFGMAKQVDESAVTHCGTSSFMAPQIFQRKPYNKSVDIWSLGVIFYHMVFGSYPFQGINILYDIYNKCRDKFKLYGSMKQRQEHSSQVQFLLADLFGGIFQLDSSLRLTLQQIQAHPLFKTENLESGKLTDRDALESSKNLPATNCGHPQGDSELQWEKYLFLSQVSKEIQACRFLSNLEKKAFEFQIQKACLHILTEVDSDQSIQLHLKQKVQKKVKEIKISLKFNREILNSENVSNVSGLEKGLDLSKRNFNEFKQSYRLTIGYIFSKVHVSVEERTLKERLKLKIFCCHTINRVFEGNSIENFPFFKQQLEERKQNVPKRIQNFQSFEKWMLEETANNLALSIQHINKLFYKK